MSKLKQCPYCKATKCAMNEPCEGCETWAEWFELQDAINGYKNE